MFRSFFRVVVVAVVVLGLTLSLAPVAQAGQRGDRTPAVVKNDGGWFEAALAWITRLVTGEKQVITAEANMAPLGSCIDPWGRCP
jgi:hypothetical protein